MGLGYISSELTVVFITVLLLLPASLHVYYVVYY